MEAIKRGRRKQNADRQLRVRIPLEDYTRLEALAQLDNTNVSEVVRRELRAILIAKMARVA